jgi:predicted AlkP superfamily phosphohydrolase/phosphomutase
MKTVIIGFDAFDPVVFEKLYSEGKTPNLGKFVDMGGYSRFSVTDPPQSEVSWTSIATGMHPGQHGIFDFVHRNPASYARNVSLLPTQKGFLGRKFVPPFKAKTIFEAAVDDGYPAMSLWWPATFPARLGSPVWSIPGLGTPDIFGRLGVGIYYSMDKPSNGDKKTRIEQLTKLMDGHFRGRITGPMGMTLFGAKDTHVDFQLISLNETNAQLTIGNQTINLTPGKWSPFIELSFRVGFGITIKSVTRVLMAEVTSHPTLYFLPLQIHPLKSPWPYGTPKSFLKNVWNISGKYLSLGWPQDTTGLEDGFISDQQFLELCEKIYRHREKTFIRLLDSYQEGLLACVFDSLDRIQHMFFKDNKEVVENWYQKLDVLFGRVLDVVNMRNEGRDIQLIVVSDHGFGNFDYKINLNRWLLNRGYLSVKSSHDESNLNAVNWERSKAYGIGLNSIYLNLRNREGHGIVPEENKNLEIQKLKTELLGWLGPDGNPVVQKVVIPDESFHGPYTRFGPDLIIGYRPGYRASALTGLGDWNEHEIEVNQDHWGSDHCFDASSVPGVIFANKGLANFSDLSYVEFPLLTIGKEIIPQDDVEIPDFDDEDQGKIEERLKELGYL